MAQQNVLNLLKRKNKWMISKEIAKILKISSGNVNVSLQKLFKQGDVLRKDLRPRANLFNQRGYMPYAWRIK